MESYKSMILLANSSIDIEIPIATIPLISVFFFHNFSFPQNILLFFLVTFGYDNF